MEYAPPNGWTCNCYVRAMDEDAQEDEENNTLNNSPIEQKTFQHN